MMEDIVWRGKNWIAGYERAGGNKISRKKKNKERERGRGKERRERGRERRNKSGDSSRKIRAGGKKKEEQHLDGMISEVRADRIIRDPGTCGFAKLAAEFKDV